LLFFSSPSACCSSLAPSARGFAPSSSGASGSS